MVLLLLVHIVLQLVIANRLAKHKIYKDQWEEISSAKTNIDIVIQELNQLRKKVTSVKEAMGGHGISWPQKLNEISDNLHRGVWLNKITLAKDALLIQGSAVSKNKTEMLSVHNFTSNLKKDENFSAYFETIELELIKSRKIKVTQIADFTIKADFKE